MSNEEFHIEDEIEESSAPNSKRVKTSMAWDFLEKFVDDKRHPKDIVNDWLYGTPTSLDLDDEELVEDLADLSISRN
ncbi:putative zinc finger BED domain-containing protein RICESLEEPER [Sesbania bispinosa]|nr:putative zinc finger BED domain-containing protein RICESLEEPER [Sesbania bispinosa]